MFINYVYCRKYHIISVFIMLGLFFPFTIYTKTNEFYNLVKEELRKKLDHSTSDIEISFSSSPTVKEFFNNINNVNNINIYNVHFNSFMVSVNYNDSLEYILSGYYKILINIPVLKYNFHKGHIIQREDIRLMSVYSNICNDHVVTEVDSIIGMELKKNLLSQVMLKKIDFISPRIVKKGKVVDVEYKTDKINLRTSLIALKDGGVNDVIPCKLMSKIRIIKKCKVINSQLVGII